MVARFYRVPRYAEIAVVWAIVETSIIVGFTSLGYSNGVLIRPLSIGFYLVFSVASFVGCSLGDDLEDLLKALFLSQIIAVPLSLGFFVVAPPAKPEGFYGTAFPSFEAGYFLVIGLWLFITSLAGIFSGWALNSIIGSNRDYSLDWKRLIVGLALAVISISLPISPLIVTGEPLVALSVAGIALLSAIVVRSGLRKKISIAPGPVGLLVVAGMLVFLLSAFSVSYLYPFYNGNRITTLIWAQCLTLIAPSLVLFRLLFRSPDLAR